MFFYISLIFSTHAKAIYTIQDAQEELKKNPEALLDTCQIYKGDNYQKARMLIKAGADVNAIDKDTNWSPLHYAVCGKNSKIVALLINAGADLMTRVEYEETPLCLASAQGNSKSIELLVNAGADINYQTKGSLDTALMIAISSAFGTKNAITLIRLGADVNKENEQRYTAFHYAAQKKNLKLTKLLLEKSADLFKQTVHCWTPLHFATEYHHNKNTIKRICSTILANVGFSNSYTTQQNCNKYTLQKPSMSQLLKNYDFTKIVEYDGYTNNTHQELIRTYYEKKYLKIVQKYILIKNDEGETAIEIAIKNRNQTATALLRQAAKALSYSELPQKIKTITTKNIEKYLQ